MLVVEPYVIFAELDVTLDQERHHPFHAIQPGFAWSVLVHVGHVDLALPGEYYLT